MQYELPRTLKNERMHCAVKGLVSVTGCCVNVGVSDFLWVHDGLRGRRDGRARVDLIYTSSIRAFLMSYPNLSEHVQHLLDELSYWKARTPILPFQMIASSDAERAAAIKDQMSRINSAVDGCRKELQDAVNLLQENGFPARI